MTRQGFDLTKHALTQYWSILVVIKPTIENIGRTMCTLHHMYICMQDEWTIMTSGQACICMQFIIIHNDYKVKFPTSPSHLY
jgi:UV DNA damage repair endonuclease